MAKRRKGEFDPLGLRPHLDVLREKLGLQPHDTGLAALGKFFHEGTHELGALLFPAVPEKDRLIGGHGGVFGIGQHDSKGAAPPKPQDPAPTDVHTTDIDKARMFAVEAGQQVAAGMAPYINNIEQEANRFGATEAPLLAKLSQPYRNILGAAVPMEQQMAHQLAAAFAEQTTGMPQAALAAMLPRLITEQRTGVPTDLSSTDAGAAALQGLMGQPTGAPPALPKLSGY